MCLNLFCFFYLLIDNLQSKYYNYCKASDGLSMTLLQIIPVAVVFQLNCSKENTQGRQTWSTNCETKATGRPRFLSPSYNQIAEISEALASWLILNNLHLRP